jgi:hypothetical protein
MDDTVEQAHNLLMAVRPAKSVLNRRNMSEEVN